MSVVEGKNGNRYRIWVFCQTEGDWRYSVVQLPAEVVILKGNSISKTGAKANARRALRNYLGEITVPNPKRFADEALEKSFRRDRIEVLESKGRYFLSVRKNADGAVVGWAVHTTDGSLGWECPLNMHGR